MHKGISEAPVLSESEREHRSKEISLWGEGKRKRFPLQPFAGDLFVVYLATKNQESLLQTISWFLIIFIYPEKDLHKGTSEAPVLSSSEREHRSKRISLWGEGKRKRFPM